MLAMAACSSVAVASLITDLVAGVAQPAAHVGEEQQLVGAQRLRDGAGGVVGVDVVELPSRSAPTDAITGM
ncbi:MAG: hypothetical protein U0S48_16455 [Solirubrobacteraceae bacterium]